MQETRRGKVSRANSIPWSQGVSTPSPPRGTPGFPTGRRPRLRSARCAARVSRRFTGHCCPLAARAHRAAAPRPFRAEDAASCRASSRGAAGRAPGGRPHLGRTLWRCRRAPCGQAVSLRSVLCRLRFPDARRARAAPVLSRSSWPGGRLAHDFLPGEQTRHFPATTSLSEARSPVLC